ncbi:MAG: hypothetical protein A2682_02155 [Candidatus Terrybacteria bacterium RIFCSPHIGHO2_01_FULL_58_15]|uniref:UMP kinase n=1 Tax=Terrybacteria sp. (strain RIFCSPHIGHO2_01_FULL_58_15) TaxID=1802363 RepID=A0A1G2PNX1_TERXR|nr:MAG: hypothetical protein A2682_02155 [Candidatus Terrybacteria bacterium RIFCSPHIGHO2_01_FULL_58_15]
MAKREQRKRRKTTKREPHIIALGGSVVAPEGIDHLFLKRFRALVRKQVRRGHRFIIVIGGGGIARTYQRAAQELTPAATQINLDTVGMRATQLNAELLRVALGTGTHPEIVNAPEKLLHLRDPIAVAAGWMPGYSTDTVAVRVAEELGAKRIVIAGRPAYVYDRDFVRYPNAKPLKRLSWREYGKIVSGRWKPGMAAPVDPVATRRAERMGLTVIVVRGTQLTNLADLLNGRAFRGTIIQ